MAKRTVLKDLTAVKSHLSSLKVLPLDSLLAQLEFDILASNLDISAVICENRPSLRTLSRAYLL